MTDNVDKTVKTQQQQQNKKANIQIIARVYIRVYWLFQMPSKRD